MFPFDVGPIFMPPTSFKVSSVSMDSDIFQLLLKEGTQLMKFRPNFRLDRLMTIEVKSILGAYLKSTFCQQERLQLLQKSPFENDQTAVSQAVTDETKIARSSKLNRELFP
jgi:hypothetical protein